MPNIKSAKKRLRQSEARKEANLAAKREVRTRCRRVREACADGNITLADDTLRTAAKCLDQAAARKVIHTNTASRLKSRLSAKVRAIKKAEPVT